MGKRFKVACVQLNSGQSVKKNLDQTLKYLTRAVKLDANLILTPEITNIVSLNQKHLLKETYPEKNCLLYTSPSPRDVEESRMPSSA